ncbi:hypothetical protein ASE01_03625 [Nocardioides sp. Root190]|uniref:hypothetical protein n=1 Tax=Nocardioides sp. Root190 TaxID=1736488 RepID=UPI0006F5ADFB|nr:hypothetical protein [Nocardioides sp. Root190]KRB78376.1 hypothetical protein ASE01_03625 [Nocardioides sp. Root190]
MTDDSSSSTTPGQPADGGAPPPPPALEPDRTVMRPRDPEPPAGAINDGDGPPAPPVPAAPVSPAPGAHAAAGAHAAPAAQPHDTAVQPPFPGGFDGEPPAPGDPEFPTRVSKAGTTGAVTAVGAGLLGAAVVIAALRSRSDGELDWSNFGVGLGATAVLLVIAVLGSLAGRKVGGRAREEIVTWPGVVGILGTAVMIVTAIEDDDNWVIYLVGGVLFVLSVIGYAAARRAAFAVVAIAGLALVYGVAFDDFVADGLDGGHPQVVAAVVVALFVVVVTLLGWVLPSRAVTGVVVGVFGLVGFVVMMATFVVARYIGEFFGSMFGLEGEMDPEGFGMPLSGPGFHEADVWWVLAFAAALTVLWALAAAISNNSGFTILAIAAPSILVPLASLALAAEHPTWWSAALAASGGVLLLGGVALARLRGKSVAREV